MPSSVLQPRVLLFIAALSGPTAEVNAQVNTPTTTLTASVAVTATTAGEPVQEEAAAVFTGVRGTIVDAKSGEALIEATIKVVKGGQGQALTDVDGNYRLALPPGSYELRAYYELYQPRRVGAVVVRSREATTVDLALSTDAEAVEEVVVEAKADRRKESALLQERKRAATVSDGVSAQEIARAPDSDAADAIKRVPAATVEGGRYVQIRGLGGRYSSTLLNGVALPSLEPDDHQVPLDLFPTSLLSNLTVSKTHRAELPGTFGGGTLLIETNTFPAELETKVKVSSGIHSASAFQSVPTHPGGGLDFLGFGAGARSLPESVPTDRPLRLGDGMEGEALEAISRDFRDVWTPTSRLGPPSLSLSGNVGNTVALGSKRLGYLGAVTLGTQTEHAEIYSAKVQSLGDRLSYREESSSRQATESGLLGVLVNSGLELDRDNRLNAFVLYAHNGDSTTLRTTGFSESDGQRIEASRLRFVGRSLVFGQLTGEHTLASLGRAAIDWQVNASSTGRTEPDTRDLTQNVTADGRLRLKTGPGSGERLFSDLGDLGFGGDVALTVPLGDSKLSAGGGVQVANRSFDARRFRMSFVGTDPATLFLPAEEMFSAERIGTDFLLLEQTLWDDGYEASQVVASAFASADVQLIEPLRVIAGLRFERAIQKLSSGTIFAINEGERDQVDRAESALLPSVNVVYALTPAMNLRAAYAFTLARPVFRELAPFLYFDFSRRRSISGNPDLEETRIHHGDLRWEWFVGETELLAASVFAKRFVRPIERVVASASQGDLTYENAPGATALGAELEARVGLGRLLRAFDDLHLAVNVALIHSSVDFGDVAIGSTTSRVRPLQGQSPYAGNLTLGYLNEDSGTEVSVLFNVYGRRVVEVGFQTLPDTYELAFHRLDVAFRQRIADALALKLVATNLLNQSEVYRQGDLTVFRGERGVSGAIALEWTP